MFIATVRGVVMDVGKRVTRRLVLLTLLLPSSRSSVFLLRSQLRCCIVALFSDIHLAKALVEHYAGWTLGVEHSQPVDQYWRSLGMRARQGILPGSTINSIRLPF